MHGKKAGEKRIPGTNHSTVSAEQFRGCKESFSATTAARLGKGGNACLL